MDTQDDGPPAKRQCIVPSELRECALPGEMRNVLYRLGIDESCNPKIEHETFTLAPDGKIISSLESLLDGRVEKSGEVPLFNLPLASVAAFAPEILSLALPEILFTFHNVSAFTHFIEDFERHTIHNEEPPVINVKLHILAVLRDMPEFRDWMPCEVDHGGLEFADRRVKRWLEPTKLLPKNAKIFLAFDCFWRDFRALHHACSKNGIHGRNVRCVFAKDTKEMAHSKWLVKQTLAAVNNVQVVEQAVPSEDDRKTYVEHGCRGFQYRYPRN